jgi:tetratricopeptide (TPR) repeat protein
VAEVYFELWERTLHDPNRQFESDTYRALAEKAIKLLRAFQKVFPIGQPAAYYYQGWYEWLSGQTQRAIPSWRKGLDAALKFKMLYEEGLIRVKLGIVLKDSTAEQKERFARAIQIFEKMGAVHELRSAKRAEAEAIHI